MAGKRRKFNVRRKESPRILLAASALMLVLAGYEVWAGRVVGSAGAVTRQDSPVLYWLVVAFHILLASAPLVAVLLNRRSRAK
jgi:hypothetical protein